MQRDRREKVWARRDPNAPVPTARKYAKQMRAVPTDAERKLWWHLRHRLSVADTHFRRQVRLGKFIVDFASHKRRLVVEVDGGQHADLEGEGYRVLRFWNNEVMTNIDGVLVQIQTALVTTPTPNPSPQGGGESK
jgi:very-short-patch-repair endonuclease